MNGTHHCNVNTKCNNATGRILHDLEVSEKKIFFDKLGSLKKTLNMWSQRDLSIVGRINIMKSSQQRLYTNM